MYSEEPYSGPKKFDIPADSNFADFLFNITNGHLTTDAIKNKVIFNNLPNYDYYFSNNVIFQNSLGW